VGLNITEEDIIASIRVSDILDKTAPFIKENTPLNEILANFSEHPYFYYPVVGPDQKLKGIVSIDSVRQIFQDKDIGDVIIADDILEPVKVKIVDTARGTEAKELFDRYHVDFIPVVDKQGHVAGMLEERIFYGIIALRQLELEQKARLLAT
jgi:CBS domain-containing protein